METRQQQANTFEGGLNTDMNPITTPNNILTDCLNGTIITHNGNEYTLQNERGNTKVPNTNLKEGYIPLQMKEHNGILYIISKNLQNNTVEIGTFPSPKKEEYITTPIDNSYIILDNPIIESTFDYDNKSSKLDLDKLSDSKSISLSIEESSFTPFTNISILNKNNEILIDNLEKTTSFIDIDLLKDSKYKVNLIKPESINAYFNDYTVHSYANKYPVIKPQKRIKVIKNNNDVFKNIQFTVIINTIDPKFNLENNDLKLDVSLIGKRSKEDDGEEILINGSNKIEVNLDKNENIYRKIVNLNNIEISPEISFLDIKIVPKLISGEYIVIYDNLTSLINTEIERSDIDDIEAFIKYQWEINESTLKINFDTIWAPYILDYPEPTLNVQLYHGLTINNITDINIIYSDVLNINDTEHTLILDKLKYQIVDNDIYIINLICEYNKKGSEIRNKKVFSRFIITNKVFNTFKNITDYSTINSDNWLSKISEDTEIKYEYETSTIKHIDNINKWIQCPLSIMSEQSTIVNRDNKVKPEYGCTYGNILEGELKIKFNNPFNGNIFIYSNLNADYTLNYNNNEVTKNFLLDEDIRLGINLEYYFSIPLKYISYVNSNYLRKRIYWYSLIENLIIEDVPNIYGNHYSDSYKRILTDDSIIDNITVTDSKVNINLINKQYSRLPFCIIYPDTVNNPSFRSPWYLAWNTRDQFFLTPYGTPCIFLGLVSSDKSVNSAVQLEESKNKNLYDYDPYKIWVCGNKVKIPELTTNAETAINIYNQLKNSFTSTRYSFTPIFCHLTLYGGIGKISRDWETVTFGMYDVSTNNKPKSFNLSILGISGEVSATYRDIHKNLLITIPIKDENNNQIYILNDDIHPEFKNANTTAGLKVIEYLAISDANTSFSDIVNKNWMEDSALALSNINKTISSHIYYYNNYLEEEITWKPSDFICYYEIDKDAITNNMLVDNSNLVVNKFKCNVSIPNIWFWGINANDINKDLFVNTDINFTSLNLNTVVISHINPVHWTYEYNTQLLIKTINTFDYNIQQYYNELKHRINDFKVDIQLASNMNNNNIYLDFIDSGYYNNMNSSGVINIDLDNKFIRDLQILADKLIKSNNNIIMRHLNAEEIRINTARFLATPNEAYNYLFYCGAYLLDPTNQLSNFMITTPNSLKNTINNEKLDLTTNKNNYFVNSRFFENGDKFRNWMEYMKKV